MERDNVVFTLWLLEIIGILNQNVMEIFQNWNNQTCKDLAKFIGPFQSRERMFDCKRTNFSDKWTFVARPID